MRKCLLTQSCKTIKKTFSGYYLKKKNRHLTRRWNNSFMSFKMIIITSQCHITRSFFVVDKIEIFSRIAWQHFSNLHNLNLNHFYIIGVDCRFTCWSIVFIFLTIHIQCFFATGVKYLVALIYGIQTNIWFMLLSENQNGFIKFCKL